MWYNAIMAGLLKSPIHAVVSKNIMLISYTGRKSGIEYTTPVNYWPVNEGDEVLLLTTSKAERVWWRNFLGEQPAAVQLRGKRIEALGTVVDDRTEKERLFRALFTQHPQIGRYFQIAVDGNHQPIADDVERTARQTILVCFVLSKA